MIEITVIDAGPLIHLDELNCLDLLEGFGAIHLPAKVKEEVAVHRPGLNWEKLSGWKISTAKISSRVAAYARKLDLDSGEIAALNLLEHLQGQLFLCDDAAARLAAESMGFKVHRDDRCYCSGDSAWQTHCKRSEDLGCSKYISGSLPNTKLTDIGNVLFVFNPKSLNEPFNLVAPQLVRFSE